MFYKQLNIQSKCHLYVFLYIGFISIQTLAKFAIKQTLKLNHIGCFEFSVTQYLLKADISHNQVGIDSAHNVSSATSLFLH